ncbi:MAG: hypothetical protein IJU40_04085 [Desulfovibrionaceae bacterium]|nr:hypothetical protein [Desulfovibrionaceae bacterium]
MNTTFLILLILASSLLELLVLAGVLFFYRRLKKSEGLMHLLQDNQAKLLQRIETNARLEREIVETFGQRQRELEDLNNKLEDRAQTLKRLLEQAEGISRSPQFLREIILNGRKKGLSTKQIARNAGLSIDEVELILAQNQPS